jgi:hypothetical protein
MPFCCVIYWYHYRRTCDVQADWKAPSVCYHRWVRDLGNVYRNLDGLVT